LSLSSNQKCTDTGKNVHRIGLLNPIVNRVIRLFLVRPLRDKHGLSRARVAYAAGGRLSQEISGLFCALLIDVEPVYGSSKDGIATSLPPQEIRIE
jgi:long-subunit acyl-CoA synthetase (AMP-forming)